MYIFVHPPILTSQAEVNTILSSHCLLYFMVANCPIRSTSSLPLFCVQILYQITVHWNFPIWSTSSLFFLQIVVPYHRSPLFVIFLSDHRPICLFVIIIIPHHRPFCLFFFANCCSNKMQQTFMNDLLPEIIAHINQNCHNQQWCAFFKLVYFLA